MNLKVILPSTVMLDERVDKVVCESPAGGFCLLAHHIDFVTALVPGILSYRSARGEAAYMAVNSGVLVKQGEQVLVCTRHAVRGRLGELQEEVDKMLSRTDEKERTTRASMTKLEADFIRRFLGFGKRG